MPESWDDLVTPIHNAMLAYLPGYATEREKFQRRVREGGPNRRDVAEAVLNAMSAVGAGPKPGLMGWASRRANVPQRDPAITGGGSTYDPTIARNSSMELATRPGVETPRDVRTRHADPPRRERRSFANDNTAGPMGINNSAMSVATPAAVGWAATVTPEPSGMAPRENEAQSNAGRFAAPLVSPDAQLATDTRLLNDRVSAATRNIEADFDFSDLVTPVTPHARRGMRNAFNAMAGS